jgi:exodeoxyribonuclease V alpha subunit
MKATDARLSPPLSPLGTARRAETLPFLTQLRDADLGDEQAFLVWQLAQLAEGLTPGQRQDFMMVLARSLATVAQGNTRMPVTDAERDVLARVPSLVGQPGDAKPLILDGDNLYHQRLLACEDHLVAAVKARIARPAPFAATDVDAVLATLFQGARPLPSPEQQAAVASALSRTLTVISGGPGTGKTTIAVHIARGLVRLGVPLSGLALAAPTGKAANRLQESLRAGLSALTGDADQALLAACPPAQTLHRLLGWSRGSFLHHENNRLSARALIVDEGSMIDLFLMDRLLRSLRDDALLIILGDADQLPSIDAGAVFRDLTGDPGRVPIPSPRWCASGEAGRLPTRVTSLAVRLTRGFRMDSTAAAGRRVAEVAAALRQGQTSELAALLDERPRADALGFSGVEIVPESERRALLDSWHARLVDGPDWQALCAHEYDFGPAGFSDDDSARLSQLHAHLQRSRILCVTRERPTGVREINRLLHERHAQGTDLTAGEPVMIVHNDYDRGLWNGDQGLVVRVREVGRPARPMAVFRVSASSEGEGARWLAFDPDVLGESLQLAFAITVHKAQGSEHDHILLLLPDVALPLCSRELIYTAVTRARSAVTICGNLPILAAGATNTLTRASGLAEKLAA